MQFNATGDLGPAEDNPGGAVAKEVLLKVLVLGTFLVWLLVSLVALFRGKGK